MIATGKCDTSLLEKYGNNDFVVDDDIVLMGGYYIPFTDSFIDSLGNSPIQKQNVLLSNGFVEVTDDGYLTYDIADLIKDKDKITIELDYMFLTYTQKNVMVPNLNACFIIKKHYI